MALNLFPRRLLRLPILLSGLAAIYACSAAADSRFDDDGVGFGSGPSGATTGSGAGDTTASGVGGGFLAGSSSASGSPSGGSSDCSEAAKLIYVLSDANDLYSFKPDTKQFTYIGPLQCPTTMQPNSMAVDRSATAWVNYVQSDVFGDTAGALYRVNTLNATCDPNPVLQMPNGWFRVGMGFSSDGTSKNETLYVTSIGTGGALGRIDMQGNQLVEIGGFSPPFSNESAELTGTGDGRLFAFFTTSPVQIVELNKTNAATLQATPLGSVEVPFSWAFSFWGGDFYLYTATTSNSRVNRHRPSDQSTDTSYIADAGFTIIGAGVSTCAPVLPPN